ncbi:hypothetical protein [Pseudomonas sp. PP3]|uniref:hypothetical protein n=1 Tax=Pseudomonas sp. PP3 TaxID=2815936 RepID=UPI001BAFC06F|nr:hypothetical protein [Pseudomonas sp. PP3]
MFSSSLKCFQCTTPFKLIQAQTAQGDKQLIYDDKNQLAYLLEETKNTTNPALQFKKISYSDIQNLNIKSITKIIQCNPAEMLKEPGLVRTVLAQYTNSTSIPNRFRAITDLNELEKTQYKQISEIPSTDALRCTLLSLIDEDLKEPFHSILNEWSKFGVSVSEIDVNTFENFKAFYDEVMNDHATQKEDYTKLDFATQNIKPRITDSRCLESKLTPFQIFKAAYQLGDIPAVSNFRFMDNPASKDDGKYREWMFHFDNSNYAAEFKLITTRVKGTAQANREQCLAAFPYDTTASIRFTQSEAATKFPNLQDLETEFRGVPGARYVVIQNPDNDTPLETGIRTEMIVHHRSASSRDGQDQGESRSSELMTFHGLDRCKPFLSGEELSQARNLTPLQTFVLGGFKTTGPEKFMECLTSEKQALNSQVRALIEGRKFKPLQSLTVAKFENSATVVTNKLLFDKQMNTYENLPEVLEKVPSLADESAWQAGTLRRMIPKLMNYDQNAELKPDCTENDAFPARTQLRERTNEAFFKPLERDLTQVKFSTEQKNLLPLEKIIDVAQNIYDLYSTYTPLLKAVHPGNQFVSLFESRAALAKEYIEQFRSRATLPETHQTLTLFTYYMLDDLDSASQIFSANNIRLNIASDEITKQKTQLLQHFITLRILEDRNKI